MFECDARRPCSSPLVRTGADKREEVAVVAGDTAVFVEEEEEAVVHVFVAIVVDAAAAVGAAVDNEECGASGSEETGCWGTELWFVAMVLVIGKAGRKWKVEGGEERMMRE